MESSPQASADSVLSPVDAALDCAVERDLCWRTPVELGALLDDAPRLQSRLDATVALAVVQAERAGVHASQEHSFRTVAQMVADRTGADPAKVRRLGRLGAWVEEFDLFAAAWGDGALLSEHVEMIRKDADNARSHAALVRDQHLFIGWAGLFDFVDYAGLVRYWLNANDQDGEEPKEQLEKNRFRARKRRDGCVKVDGLFDPLTGDAFMTAFEHEDQKLFRQNETKEAGLPDSPSQRGVNAIMHLVVRGFQRKDGSFPVPLISVVASESVIEDTIERVANPSSDPLPIAFDDIDKRCELLDGTPLHPNYLLALLGIATFRRQILNAKGRTIDVSVNARCFTPWQQTALRVEARGRCQTRGCDAPFAWLQADHIEPHSKGGLTLLANGKMRCGPDNKAKGDRTDKDAA